jgi:hypothetical protein
MPYPNDLPQEVDRRAEKCISCNLQLYGNHRKPTQAIFSQCCSTPSHEATRNRERPVTYIQEPTDNETCHTQMIFHKKLTKGRQNVSAITYSLSIHLQIQFLMLTLTDLYRNVHVILKLLLTLSVGSCLYVTGLSRLFVAS